jgi:hypothetical protein
MIGVVGRRRMRRSRATPITGPRLLKIGVKREHRGATRDDHADHGGRRPEIGVVATDRTRRLLHTPITTRTRPAGHARRAWACHAPGPPANPETVRPRP